MKIDNLKINGFGKIIDKEINLSNNINVVYGKNEAGKSTLLKFINCMFYGASKNKNGKDISDFDMYKPWKTEDFSGKIKYTLDDKKTYEIYRDFRKKSPIIYNESKEDISSKFNIDKSKGIDFVLEQTGLDELTFNNTILTYQDEIKMDKVAQNSIIQKISNLVSSGDENVSFKKTLDKINKLQTEQVGTDRTVGRPINLVDNEIEKLKEEKNELDEFKTVLQNKTDEIQGIKNTINNEEIKLELLRREKAILEDKNLKLKELSANEDIINNFNDKISELEEKIDKKSKKNIEKEKKSFLKNYVLFFIFVCLSIILFFTKINKIIPAILAVIAGIIGVVTIFNKLKFKNEKKRKISEIDELENKINQEIEIIRKNKEEQIEIIKSKKQNIEEEIKKAEDNLCQNFNGKLDIDAIKSVLNLNYDEILMSNLNMENKINNLKIDVKTKENQNEEMMKRLDNLSQIEEKLELAENEKRELISLNNSFNIAKECMEIAYKKIRESLSPEFTNELCNLISKISDNKYNNIKFSDTEGLTVEIDDGRYVPAERLSIGTIDEMYLSLRLSSLNTISKENMFIILDEAFAYFDDYRLKNIIKFMSENYKDKQIIIFTCSDREKNVLNELKIKYNLINLES